jgi:hypothetical protein
VHIYSAPMYMFQASGHRITVLERLFKPYMSDSGKAGLTRRNPVDDTFPYHDNRCMDTT